MSTRHKGLFTGIAVVAIVAIAYFAFLYPPPSKDDATGTIGAADANAARQALDARGVAYSPQAFLHAAVLFRQHDEARVAALMEARAARLQQQLTSLDDEAPTAGEH